jgi:hypothetical protein
LARLHGLPDCYRIKWRTAGYRLVHQVNDKVVVVTVVAVGKRDKGLVHRLAASALSDDWGADASTHRNCIGSAVCAGRSCFSCIKSK